jgi:hypothetical protein
MDIFSDTFVPTALTDWWFRSQPCPACEHEALRPVANLGPTQWLCANCGTCWIPVQGHLQLVDPWRCAGCATRGRSECVSRCQHNRPVVEPTSAVDALYAKPDGAT